MDRDFYHALSRLAPMIAVVVVMSIVNACKKPQPVALPKPASEAQVEAGAILPPVAKKRVLEVPVWTQTIAVADTQVQPLSVQIHSEPDMRSQSRSVSLRTS